MKKVLLFFGLLLIGYGAYAQSAALKLVNYNNDCTVYVNVMAADANLSNPSACDIQSCVIVIAPGGTTISYANPSLVPICGQSTPYTGAMLAAELASASPNWIWTDATFQFVCPSSDCSEGGGVLSANLGSCLGAPTPCLTGVGASTVWYPVVCGAFVSANWLPASSCFMTDTEIDFY